MISDQELGQLIRKRMALKEELNAYLKDERLARVKQAVTNLSIAIQDSNYANASQFAEEIDENKLILMALEITQKGILDLNKRIEENL